jgi:hypothetical protein
MNTARIRWKIAVLLAAVVVGLFIAFAAFSRSVYRSDLESAKAAYVFAEQSIKVIGSSWDVDALIERASPAYKAVNSREELQKGIGTASKAIGAVTSVEIVKIDTIQHRMFLRKGRSKRTVVFAKLQSSKATANCTMDLVDVGEGWRIDRLRFSHFVKR